MQEFNEDVTIYNNIAVGGSVSAASISLAGKDIIRAVANELWPVGSIYTTINNVNPSGQFGGTWVVWGTGRVAVGVDVSQEEFNTVEKTGGATNVAMTIEEMPLHTHGVRSTGTGTVRDVLPITHVACAEEYFPGAGKIEYAGKGTAHNNLQPYITAYMWKRTA